MRSLIRRLGSGRAWAVCVLSVLVSGVGVCVFQAYALTPEEKAKLRYDHLILQEVVSVAELADVWAAEAWNYIPAALPGAVSWTQTKTPLPVDLDAFPKAFLDKLVWTLEGASKTPVAEVLIYQERLERSICFLNSDYKLMYVMDCPYEEDCDDDAYPLDRVPTLYDGGFSPAEIEEIIAHFDVARVLLKVELVESQDLFAFLLDQAKAEDDEEDDKDDGGGAAKSGGGGGGSFGSNDFWVSIHGGQHGVTNGIEIVIHPPVGSTNAMELYRFDVANPTNTFDGIDSRSWSLILSTNAVGTNPIVWVDTTTTNLSGVWHVAVDAGIDGDGDGLNDGSEILAHRTSPDLADTDGDGFSDGAEINTYGTDPLEQYSGPPPADITVEGKVLVGRLDTLDGVETNNVQIKSVNIGGWLAFEQWMLAFEPKVITNALGVVTTNQTDDAALCEEFVNNVDFAQNLLAAGNNGASGINTQQTWQGPAVSIIGSFGNGDWVRFTNVDFGTGVSNLSVILAYDGSSSNPQIEVRLGSSTGTKVGTLDVLSSGHWSDLTEQTIPLSSSISGTQTVYFVGKSTSGDIGNIHRFRLFREPNTMDLLDTFRDNYFTTNDLDNLKSLGYNCVRVPFLHNLIQDGTGTNYLEEGWARLDWVIGECQKRHMWVLLDLHGTPGGQNGFDHSGPMEGTRNRLWNSSDYQNRTAALWAEVAKRYETNSAVVGYDVFNEPDATGTGTKTQVYSNSIIPVLDKVYDAIRSNDTQHVIFMESNFMYTNMWDDIFACPAPSSQGWSNIVYEFHHYDRVGNWGGDSGDSTFETQKDIADEIVRTYTRFSKERQVPVYIGEFMPIEMPNFEYFIRQFEANGIHWAHWNYRHWGHDDANRPWSSWGLDYRTNGVYGSVNTNIQPEVKSDSFATLSDKLARYNHTEYGEHPHLRKVVSNHNLDPAKAAERTEFHLNTFSGPDVFSLSNPNGWPWRKVAAGGADNDRFWVQNQRARLFLNQGPVWIRIKSREEADARFEVNDETGSWFAIDPTAFNVTNNAAGYDVALNLSALRDGITDPVYEYDTAGVIVRYEYDESGSAVRLTVYAKNGGMSTNGTQLYQSSGIGFSSGGSLELFVNHTNATVLYNGTSTWSGAHGLDIDAWPNGAVGVVEADDPASGRTQFAEMDNLKAWRPNAQTGESFADDFTSYVEGIAALAEPEKNTLRRWSTTPEMNASVTNNSLLWIPEARTNGGSWYNPRLDYQKDVRLDLSGTNIVELQVAYDSLSSSNFFAKVALMPEYFPGEIFDLYVGRAIYLEITYRLPPHAKAGNLAFDLWRHIGQGARDWVTANDDYVFVPGQTVSFQVSTNWCEIYYGTNLLINQAHGMTNMAAAYSEGVFPHLELQNRDNSTNVTAQIGEVISRQLSAFGTP